MALSVSTSMIKILVKKQMYYPVSSVKVKREVTRFLEKKGIRSDTIVSIAFIGKEKMKKLSDKYLKDNRIHNVLSFTESEVIKKFVYPPGEYTYLGEVVICYPLVFEEARKENKLIDTKVFELVRHGLMHLMGVHHE